MLSMSLCHQRNFHSFVLWWVRPRGAEFLRAFLRAGAEYVTLDNKIKRLSLAIFLLATPPTVTGTAYMWGLLIANHLDQSFMIDLSEILSCS
jgi:hypothetical protein